MFLLLSIAVHGAESHNPAKETRALWVTRWDYATPNDVRKIVSNAASANFNTIFFQVRGEATVFYPSNLEPWAWELTSKSPATLGQDPSWDPLALAIQEAHANSLELHAYLNILTVWKHPEQPPGDSNHILIKHPEWLMHNRDGEPMESRRGFYRLLNPMHPEAADHVVAIFEELISRYPVDGVHLDYIRFPDEYDNGDLSYDPVSLKLFREWTGRAPRDAPEHWDYFRAKSVTNLVKRIHDTTKKHSPNAMLSAAVVADYNKAAKICHQRSLDWLNAGLVDALVPMNYTDDLDLFQRRAEMFFQNKKRGYVYMGLQGNRGADAIRREISYVRFRRGGGIGFFAYGTIFPGHQINDLGRMISEEIFVEPTRIAGRRYEN